MSAAWLLPEHIADVLPAQARHIEEMRRDLLDLARRYGYELVLPPLLEHLDALLTGASPALQLRTFKLVDQLSGRTLGLRSDTTAQVARIDAHLLNRQGVTRLCYCGPVVHTRPASLHGGREPLQLGAEIYGHAGIEADIEILDLALDCLAQAQCPGVVLDLGDVRLLQGLWALKPGGSGAAADPVAGAVSALSLESLADAMGHKDRAQVAMLLKGQDPVWSKQVLSLLDLYGSKDVIHVARRTLPAHPLIDAALGDLLKLADHVEDLHRGWQVSVDLAFARGQGYYTGMCFAMYAQGWPDALVRGGRYDEVGAVFGRSRPAAGFSLDLKIIAEFQRPKSLAPAVMAPWGEASALRDAVRRLRLQGDTVVCVLPGHEHEGQEIAFDRQLVQVDGEWQILPLSESLSKEKSKV